jgi:hypothetical protein
MQQKTVYTYPKTITCIYYAKYNIIIQNFWEKKISASK